MEIGYVAKCNRGYLGLITKIAVEKGRTVYEGICLEKDKVGKDWQSFNPTFVLDAREFVCN